MCHYPANGPDCKVGSRAGWITIEGAGQEPRELGKDRTTSKEQRKAREGTFSGGDMVVQVRTKRKKGVFRRAVKELGETGKTYRRRENN